MKRMFLLLILVSQFALNLQAQTTQGTWAPFDSAHQDKVYQTAVQQPINYDDSSTFNASRGVVPVKFSLSTGLGPLTIESTATIADGGVTFTPASALSLSTLTNLIANFTMSGSCGGGSPRFAINYGTNQNIFVYLGAFPNFDDAGCTASGSAFNFMTAGDARFDSSQLITGTQYNTLANLALTTWWTTPINYISFVVDGGWLGPQTLTVSGVTVNDNSISGAPVALAPTCNLPPATIQVYKVAGPTQIPVDEAPYLFPADNGSDFRISNCQYIYNLGIKAIITQNGLGTYTAQALIGDVPIDKKATFGLK